MSETLFPYYESELIFIRQYAQEFAKKYPAAAGRLLLEQNRSTDPHVERLIQSFALISARIQRKIDDEFPELTDALLNVLYPHYLAPVPSMGIVQFELAAAQAQLPNGFSIERHRPLQTNPVGDLRCRFRTGYPVTLWPVECREAQLLSPPFPPGFRPPARTAGALRFVFECQGKMDFSQLTLETLRVYLSGGNHVTSALYELIFNHATQIVFRALEGDPDRPQIVLSPQGLIGQVGFEEEEGLLPYTRRSFPGYRLLTEFFTFPNKFLFFDLGGWRRVAEAKLGNKVEVMIFLDRTMRRLEPEVDCNTFRLGCTPIVNLFEQVSEPIGLNHARYEYRVTPDVHFPTGKEIYSIDSVYSIDPVTSQITDYEPFYAFRHGGDRKSQQTFWYASRRQSTLENDRGTDIYLNLVDRGFNPRLPSDATLVARTTCTNRNLPAQLQLAGEDLHFELLQAAPLSAIRCVESPTTPLRPPLKRGSHWALISHLNLNQLSISDPVEGRAALQEILSLYDFSDPDAGQQQLADVNQQIIEGIIGVGSRRVVGRTSGGDGVGFARGVEVTIDFDEQKYVGTGVFLFASVLERFLGLYASINSFSQLVARTKQREGAMKTWPPRTANLPLI